MVNGLLKITTETRPSVLFYKAYIRDTASIRRHVANHKDTAERGIIYANNAVILQEIPSLAPLLIVV